MSNNDYFLFDSQKQQLLDCCLANSFIKNEYALILETFLYKESISTHLPLPYLSMVLTWASRQDPETAYRFSELVKMIDGVVKSPSTSETPKYKVKELVSSGVDFDFELQGDASFVLYDVSPERIELSSDAISSLMAEKNDELDERVKESVLEFKKIASDRLKTVLFERGINYKVLKAICTKIDALPCFSVVNPAYYGQ